ncbi:MAG: hypothetical protein JRS35_17930, partial [Deltaproteobacteria bacterium]|nr:hypothetical protein [Deltaproteobacteria bacterium]
LSNGDDIPSVAGVEFTLSSGGAAKFIVDGFPREFGPQDTGALNNFWGYATPYPDLEIRLPAVIHRVGFELRVNDLDDVVVTLLSSGSIVDEVTIPSRGSDQLYFYGFENPAGFDEVLLDVQANASGAFVLDNLRFESLGAPPAEGPPLFSCVGFSSPLEALLDDPRYAKYAKYAEFLEHWLRRSPVKLLRARLLDAEDLEVGDADLITAPMVQVLFSPAQGEETLDVTADTTWKDSFSFSRKGYWRLSLSRYQMKMPGTYLVTMESGDESEYLVDPTCSESIIEKAPKPKKTRKSKKTRKHHHRRH